MKKLSILLALLLCLMTLAACGQKKQGPEESDASLPSPSVDIATPTPDPDAEDPANSDPTESPQPGANPSPTPSATSKPESSPAPQGDGNQTGGGSQPGSNPGNNPTQPPSTPKPPPSTPTPTPQPDPAPTPEPTPEPKPAGPFDYPFNPDQIVSEMKGYGQRLGLTYGTGSSSGQSVTASQSYQGSSLRSGLQSAISFLLSEDFKAYGGETPTHFRIGYSGSSGSYTFTIYY